MKEYLGSAMMQNTLKTIFMRNRNKCSNIGSCMRIKGKIEYDLFREAVQFTYDRHEILRTRLVERENVTYMKVEEAYTYKLDLRYAKGSTLEEKYTDAINIYNEQLSELHNPFEEMTVFFFLIKIEEDDHLFCFISDHIFSDGYSMSIVYKNVFTYLFSKGKMPMKEVVQYSEYAIEEQNLFSSEEGRKKIEYWIKTAKLLNEKKVNGLSMLTDEQKMAEMGTLCECCIDGELRGKVVKTAKKYCTSVFNILLAAFHKTLCDIYDSEVTFLQIASANREEKKYRETIGPFVKVIPNVIEHDKDETKDALINKIKDRMKNDIENAKYLKNFREMSSNPNKYGFMMTYQNYADYPINKERKILNHSFSLIIPKEEVRFSGGCCFFGYEDDEKILFVVNWDDTFFTVDYFENFFSKLLENVEWICR